jgi:putative (di)nucleoside polyphosphate hydrolase
VLDKDGYRQNVAMVVLNKNKQVFWGKRKGEYSWQFPQGGVNENEDYTDAMFRELYEEVGLLPHHVKIIYQTPDWRYYDVPKLYSNPNRFYRGQKQIWFLLEFLGKDYHVNIQANKTPEFDAWRWVDYWLPQDEIIGFKQNVYKTVLQEFSQYCTLDIYDK